MSTIDVEVLESGVSETVFRVTIREGASESSHRVTLQTRLFEKLHAADEDASTFVRRCFEFLLERESKESILSTFDVGVIGKYFPEFEATIRR